jgi:hypothetical protein
MRDDHLTVGYHKFSPIRQNVLFPVKEHRLSGVTTSIRRDEVDITWVRESNAFVLLSWKGRELKRYSCYHDQGSFLSSGEERFVEAAGLAKNLEITKESELEVHVIHFLIDKPTLGFVKKEWGNDYYQIARSSEGEIIWRDNPAVEDRANFTFETFPYEDRSQIKPIRHSPTKVWSSAWSEQECADAFAEFKKLATASEWVIGETDYPFDR